MRSEKTLRPRMALIERIHKRWLMWALKRTKGNRQKAAMILGLSTRTISNWIHRFDLIEPDRDKHH